MLKWQQGYHNCATAGNPVVYYEEVLQFGLTFSDAYMDAPFHDDNWQLIRVQGSKKAFLWTYEKDENLCINVSG